MVRSPCDRVTPGMLLKAYSIGVFPMAGSVDDPWIVWVAPQRRGILPLESFHVSRSLRRRIRKGEYRILVNADFDGTVAGCANRPTTWISGGIRHLFNALHQSGYAHSIEVHDLAGSKVGGLYGLAIGGAFFAESMYSLATDASKIALAHLVARLRYGGFRLLDVQFLSPHLASLGAIELSAESYRIRLDAALAVGTRADFFSLPDSVEPAEILRLTCSET